MPITLICKTCGKPFVKAKSLVSRNAQFCSQECHYKQGRTIKPCELCGQPMEGWKSAIKRRRFCSRTCRWAFEKMNNGEQKNNHIIKKCEFCGNEFNAKKEQIRFCSNSCARKWVITQNGAPNGKLHGRWIGRGRTERTMRNIAQKLLPARCAICGWDICACDAHHIVPGINILPNIILLCPNHHRMANKGLINESQLKQAWEHAYSHLSLPQDFCS